MGCRQLFPNKSHNGKAALEVVGSNHPDIQLVLTDVVMKGMTGPELVLGLMVSHPGIKVVNMSGYTGEVVAHQGVGTIRLLEKPFTRGLLLKILDAALGWEREVSRFQLRGLWSCSLQLGDLATLKQRFVRHSGRYFQRL